MKSIILIYFICFNCHSQKITFFKDKVDKIENECSVFLENKEYVIFGTIYKMNLIVKKENDFYHFVYVNIKGNMELFDVNNIENNCLELVFHKAHYKEGIIDSDSTFYKENPIKNVIGDPFYFSFTTDKKRYCEYFLTTSINPSPIEQEVNNYLGSIMIGYLYNCEK